MQLLVLKVLLLSFGESTTLKVNYHKSVMMPINISEERLDHLPQTFNCDKGKLPFTYPGLPLSLIKPRVIDFSPIVAFLFTALFVAACWSWLQLQIDQHLNFLQNLEMFMRQLCVPFFTEIIIIMCWTIWFNQIQPSIQGSKRAFKEEFVL